MPMDTAVDPPITEIPPTQIACANAPLFGTIALAAAFGVELMLTAFVAWGRITNRLESNQFTFHVRAIMRPERDLPIYVAGIALTLLQIILVCWGWIRLTRRGVADCSAQLVAGIRASLAIVGLVAFLFLLGWLVPFGQDEHRQFMGLATGLSLVLAGIAVIVLAALDYRFQFSSRGIQFLVWVGPALMLVSIYEQFYLAPTTLQLTALIVVLLLWFWMRIARRRDEDQWKRRALERSAILAAMAAGSFAVYETMLPAAQRTLMGSWFTEVLAYRTLIPVFAMLLCLLVYVHAGLKAASGVDRRRSQILCHLIVVSVLLATVFVPQSQWLGNSLTFLKDDDLHHWNYFAFGPALAFAHGRALVTEIYSQYGVGWPYLFATLGRAIPLSYANVFGESVIYGCVYVLALYVFLRLLLRNAGWAACGAIMAVSLQLFCGTPDFTVIWNFPSSTMLRHPFDVWFFLILLGHNRFERRFGSRGWFAAAGAICGLALLFELDTGIDLLLVLCFYWLLQRLYESGLQILRSRKPWVDLFGSLSAAAAIWLVGLEVASRGGILHQSFWSQYFEGLHNQAFSGLGLLPVADVPGDGMAVLAGMLVIYFFAIGIAGARIWLKAGSEIDLFLGSISAYGLGLLLLFVGRSHPFNLYHPMMPLAVVIILLSSQFCATVLRGVAWSSLSWVIFAASTAFLWSKPEFLHYPSLLKSAFTASASRERNYTDEEREVAEAIKQLPVDDENVAVLDDRDTLLDFLSNRSPWSRYTSLFYSLLTNEMVDQTDAELLKRNPQFIVIRSAPPRKWDFDDIWEHFYRFLPPHYELTKTVGTYEFWRSNRS